MRIDGNAGAQALPEGSRSNSAVPASGDTRPAATSAPGEDQAQLSGSHVQALTAQALQLPEVRQEKVNALRQVVQSGNYQPDAGQTADALFRHLLVEPAA